MSSITPDNAWAYQQAGTEEDRARQASLLSSMTQTVPAKVSAPIVTHRFWFWGAPEGIYRLVDSLASKHGVSLTYLSIGKDGLFFKTHSAEFEARGEREAVEAFRAAFNSIRSY